ncbi:MAG: hypothetical protein GY781_12665 [Gammaproteobacteria bacterium]|nr:hypothetical protein [Gammaproteobacteria bacterium]
MFYLLFLNSNAAKAEIDIDLYLRQQAIGTWKYNEGSSHAETTYFADGRVEGNGIMTLPDNDLRVFIKGNWEITDGYLIETIVETNIPDEFLPYNNECIEKIESVSSKKMITIDEEGERCVYTKMLQQEQEPSSTMPEKETSLMTKQEVRNTLKDSELELKKAYSDSTVIAKQMVLDGSSSRSLEASLSKMTGSLDEQQQMELLEALTKIILNVDVGDVQSEEALEKSQEEAAKILDGKSFLETIAIASKLQSNEQAEQAIVNMQKMGTSADYQHDADIVRLSDMKQFGKYLQKFYKETGHYPLQGISKLPVYVYVASNKQEQYTKPGPDYPHIEKSLEELIEELESVLKEEIIVPFDPQSHPDNKPNYYIYMVEGDIYNFAVNLHNSYTFTRKVSDYYHKLEISNYPVAGKNIISYEELSVNEDFSEALEDNMIKQGYFQYVREEQQKEWRLRRK